MAEVESKENNSNAKYNDLLSVVDRYLGSDDQSIGESISNLKEKEKESEDKKEDSDAKEQIQEDVKVEESVNKEEGEDRTAEAEDTKDEEPKEDLDNDVNGKIAEEHKKLDKNLKIAKERQKAINRWKRDLKLDTKRDKTEAEIRKTLDLSESADVDEALDYLDQVTGDFIEEGYKTQKDFIQQKVSSDHFAENFYFKQWKESNPKIVKEAEEFMKSYGDTPLKNIPNAKLTIARALNTVLIEEQAFKSQEVKKSNKKGKVKPKPTSRTPSSSTAVASNEDVKANGSEFNRIASKDAEDITRKDAVVAINDILESGGISFVG